MEVDNALFHFHVYKADSGRLSCNLLGVRSAGLRSERAAVLVPPLPLSGLSRLLKLLSFEL